MPRPAAKRNRLTSRPKKDVQQSTERDNTNSIDNSGLQSGSKQDDTSVQDSEFVRKLRNQTPVTKAQGQAIESSPMGERGATGSRPPTRARGYSSTLSVAGRKGDMSSKIPGTPAFESSILSNFRRRPRQPSILQMMQTEDGSSDLDDLDDDDFLGGLSPEDESTPLNLSRGKSLLLRHAVSLSPSEPSLLSSSASRKRKRAVDELQVPQSPLGIVEDTPAGSPVSDNENECDTPVELPEQLEPQEAFSQTMAPPMSSSPLSSPISIPSTPGRRHSPSAIEEHAKEAFGNKIHVATATLQDRLLPRRRQRRRRRQGATDFDVPSDDSEDDYPAADQDDDELSYLPSRKPAQSQRKRREKAKPLGNTRTRQKKPKSAETVDNQAKNTKDSSAQSDLTTKVSKDTADIDKENQPVDMSSPLSSLDSDAFESDSSPESTPEPNYLSEEIKLQAKKFAEIDKWEMEFEDVITSGSQTSVV